MKSCCYLRRVVIWDLVLFLGGMFLPAGSVTAVEAIKLHSENPHYFFWRGKPAILITSGEHYGAVLNREFDYTKYFRKLQQHGFNLTRTFSGAYCEPPGAFRIENNTLAPAKGKLICPWARSNRGGYANGGNKFDLTRWDKQYFQRLHDFLKEAGKRGVVVELVLFCPFYKDSMWELSPMNAQNNVNGFSTVKREDVYTLNDKQLQTVQDMMVRKIVEELKGYDNLYYEICNEPYFGGVTLAWQRHIAQVIVETEKRLGVKHLIAQNIANKGKKITEPFPEVSIFNFHYCKPPKTVAENYHLNRVLGDDETGFSGSSASPYRREGWDFILAGGAVYSNLDYTFTVGHEDGTARVKAPGNTDPALHTQLAILKKFMDEFDFVKMQPDNSVIKGGVPDKATARALVWKGNAYAIYVNGGGLTNLVVELPKGKYRAEWVDTKTGDAAKSEVFDHGGGQKQLEAPKYSDDIALRIVKVDGERRSLLFESDFEGGNLEGWGISGNRPAVTQTPVRAGRYAMKVSLDRHKDKVAYRTEVSGPGSEVGKRRYDGGKNYDLGAYERGRWTDWVVHVKWSYGKEGVLEIFKDGRLVVDQRGPNAFNDAKGPYFKMGLYKGWRRAEMASDVVSRRVLYHDEFRMAGAGGTYSDVAAGD